MLDRINRIGRIVFSLSGRKGEKIHRLGRGVIPRSGFGVLNFFWKLKTTNKKIIEIR